MFCCDLISVCTQHFSEAVNRNFTFELIKYPSSFKDSQSSLLSPFLHLSAIYRGITSHVTHAQGMGWLHPAYLQNMGR